MLAAILTEVSQSRTCISSMGVLTKRQKQRIAVALWRRPTAVFRPLPDVLGLGAQRSGTSSLFYYLTQHPSFEAPIRKEIHFFDKNYNCGLNWYRAHFSMTVNSGNATSRGEVSPFYLFHPYCPARIARALPHAKFIVLLRDPVHRAISHYWKQRTSGYETLDIESAFAKERERLAEAESRISRGETDLPWEYQKFSYVSRGYYATQLRRYFAFFPRERFLILQSERFRMDTKREMDKVFEFLHLEPMGDRLNVSQRSTGKEIPDVPRQLLDRLHEHFRPLNRELFELLGEEWEW